MAVAALTSMDAGATVIGTLGGAAANFLLGVGANWAADESRDFFSRPVDLRFNHHLKRAMAEALGRCLADDVTHSATLLHALRDAPLNQRRLAELVLRWRNRVQAAIASESNELIDALFPPMDQATLSVGYSAHERPAFRPMGGHGSGAWGAGAPGHGRPVTAIG